MTANPLVRLGELGQSPWYDFITRDLVASGELARLIREDGLRGLTSNPTIFEKAVASSASYDDDIRRLAEAGRSPAEIFEAIAVDDVRAACDAFRSTYEAAAGAEGRRDGEDDGPSLDGPGAPPTSSHDQRQELLFSEKLACADCGVSYEELAPRMFSFNSPYGACPECDGLGVRMEIDGLGTLENPVKDA